MKPTNLSLQFLLVLVFATLAASSECHALKVQQMTPLDLLKNSDIVVSAKIDQLHPPWKATVLEIIKSRKDTPNPREIQFNSYGIRPEDTPQFKTGDSYLLFLRQNQDGSFQCVSYGKQAVWPKDQPEWPFDQRHVATFQETKDAFRLIYDVQNDPDSNAHDAALAEALKKENSLLSALALELITSEPVDKLPLTRKTFSIKTDQEPVRSVAEIVKRSELVVTGVVSEIHEVALEEAKGKGPPLQIRECQATLKIEKVLKGDLTAEELKSGTIIFNFRKVDDDRYKGDTIPPLSKGAKYYLFVRVFKNDNGSRIALLNNQNNIRSGEIIDSDPMSEKSLRQPSKSQTEEMPK